MPTIDRTASATTTGVNIYLGGDRTPLHYRFWIGGRVGSPILVCVHGIEGHSLWFDRAAAELSQQGISVYAADRRGAGLNRDTNNSVTCRTLLSDLNAFLSIIKLHRPNSNIYLLGNCWGGALSILCAKKTDELLSGLILSCPAIKTLCDLSLQDKLSVAWSYLINSRKEFPFPLTPEMFTGNPEYLEFIADDELRTTAADAHFLIETLKMQYAARQSAPKLKLPALVLQAGKDAIVDSTAVAQWFRRLKSANKSYRYFEDSAHSLDFEPDISEYLNAITSWIKETELG